MLTVIPEGSAPPIDCLRSGSWEFIAPDRRLSPEFCLDIGGDSPSLSLRGNGLEECFGYARCTVPLRAGCSYRLSVHLTAEGIDPVEHHIVHGLYGTGYSGGIQTLRRDGFAFAGSERFPGPDAALEAQLRLYFRFSARGKVTWSEVTLEECPPIPPRIVTIACREGRMPPGGDLAFWSDWIDRAAARGADLVLLPENFDGVPPAQAASRGESPAALLAAKARQRKVFTCAAFYERRDDCLHNTAWLFDRDGAPVGSYDKRMPFEGELDEGVSPGTRSPVFDTTLGRVGMMICYDAWFPRLARALAEQGAEIVLVPSWGHWNELLPVRAADNGFCIAASSLESASGVWDSGGAGCYPDVAQSRLAPTAIVSYERLIPDGMLLASVDLSKRYSPHWAGGFMRSAPGGRRIRQTGIHPLV